MSFIVDDLENSKRLWSVARRLLAPERTYSQEHIKTKLEVYLKASPERAHQGFTLMVKNGVLIHTGGLNARYYLGDTTPF